MIPLLRTLIVLGGVLLLELLCRSDVLDPTIIVAPSQMAMTLGRLLISGEIAHDLAVTARNIAIAVVLSVCLGFLLGLLLVRKPALRRIAQPILSSYYAVPVVVIYPVLVANFGMNDLPIILTGVAFALIVMAVCTMDGIDRVPLVVLKSARILGLDPARSLFLVVVPAAAANLLTGIRMVVAYAVIGIIAGEFILSGVGLGHQLAYAYNNFDNRRMYALMLLICALVVAVNGVLRFVDNALARRWGRLP